MENLPSKGESPKDATAQAKYLDDVARGKSALQLDAVKKGMTSDVRNSWLPRSFTAVTLPSGQYDAIICTVSYHYHKHGQKYGSIAAYTTAAKKYFAANKTKIKPEANGDIKLPKGTFDKNGKIVTFAG